MASTDKKVTEDLAKRALTFIGLNTEKSYETLFTVTSSKAAKITAANELSAMVQGKIDSGNLEEKATKAAAIALTFLRKKIYALENFNIVNWKRG